MYLLKLYEAFDNTAELIELVCIVWLKIRSSYWFNYFSNRSQCWDEMNIKAGVAKGFNYRESALNADLHWNADAAVSCCSEETMSIGQKKKNICKILSKILMIFKASGALSWDRDTIEPRSNLTRGYASCEKNTFERNLNPTYVRISSFQLRTQGSSQSAGRRNKQHSRIGYFQT